MLQFWIFQLKRGELFQRSDVVIPEIVAALAAEMAAVDAAPLAYDTGRILREYYQRLEAVDSLDRPKSLANMKKVLEEQRQKKELEIAQLLLKKPAPTLSEGSYAWYSHTKVHAEDRIERTMVRDPVVGGDAGPSFSEAVSRYSVNVPDHTRKLMWVVKKLPVQDENGAGCFNLQIDVSAVESVGGNAGIEPHAGPDEYEEDSHQAELANMRSKVADHAAIVEALVSVHRLEAIAAAGRQLIAKWSIVDAKALSDTIKPRDFDTWARINEVAERQRQREGQEKTDKMDVERKHFDEVTAEGYKRVREAIDQARKEKWRADFRSYVTLLGQSYDFYIEASKDTKKSPAGGGASGTEDQRKATRRLLERDDVNGRLLVPHRPEIQFRLQEVSRRLGVWRRSRMSCWRTCAES